MVRKLGQKRVLGAFTGVIAVSVVIAFLWSSCGKKSDDDDPAVTPTDTSTDPTPTANNDVVISGQLNLTGGYLTQYNLTTTYTLYCVTFEESPKPGIGNVNPDTGEFKLTLENAKNKAFGCFVRNGTTTVATLTFEDTASKGMDGSSLKSGSLSLAGDATFDITLDLDKGIAVANVTEIKDEMSEVSGDLFDPSGDWVVEAMTDTPDGYDGPCATPGQDCQGPAEGQHLYMKRLEGKTFTPDAACQAAVDANTFNGSTDTCNGTPGNDPVYGLMVWASKTAFDSCGGVLGMTENDARAHANVTFEGSEFTTGAFTWSTEVTVDSVLYHLTDGWKATEATATYVMSNCTYNETTGIYDCSGSVAEQGDPCSGITAGALWKEKCYANFYYSKFQNVMRSSENICLNNRDFNWGATTAEDFGRNTGMSRAGLLYLMNGMTYAGPNTATIKNQSYRTDGFQTTNNSNNVWKTCPLSTDETITLTKISATEAIIDMQMVTKVANSDQACIDGMASKVGESRTMAKLVRQ